MQLMGPWELEIVNTVHNHVTPTQPYVDPGAPTPTKPPMDPQLPIPMQSLVDPQPPTLCTLRCTETPYPYSASSEPILYIQNLWVVKVFDTDVRVSFKSWCIYMNTY